MDNGIKLCVATVEIKTGISGSSLNKSVERAVGAVYVGDWTSQSIREVFPTDHLLQLLHQYTVIGVNAALNACTFEAG